MANRQYILGIDGGGTKTAFELADLFGKPVSTHSGTGISYRQHGYEKVLSTITEGRERCLAAAKASPEDVLAVCVGLPCYGEYPENDKEIVPMIRERLAPARMLVVNDTEVAWAGSLACRPGINVVAGTGSIAFAQNAQNETGRCGGWSSVYGDEGSAYWAGIKTMELFMKEADGRKPKGACYTVVCEALSLSDDIAFVALMSEQYLPYRDKVAAMQLLLEKAALAGDEAAKAVYLAAAEELALLVDGLRGRLAFPEGFLVSYSGGMFKAGDLILPAFIKRVQAMGGKVLPPAHTPVHGAVLLAQNMLEKT